MGQKDNVWQKYITTAGNGFLAQELKIILDVNLFIDNDFLLFAFESLMILRAL